MRCVAIGVARERKARRLFRFIRQRGFVSDVRPQTFSNNANASSIARLLIENDRNWVPRSRFVRWWDRRYSAQR